jgi:hypothetical protein
MFNPLAVLAWLMVFIMVGIAIGKPTSFIIAWSGLAITGVFNAVPIYAQWSLFLLIVAFMLYHFFYRMRRV